MVDTKSLEQIMKENGYMPKNLIVEKDFCNSKGEIISYCSRYHQDRKSCPETCHYAKEKEKSRK